jgi:hypothetical protein
VVAQGSEISSSNVRKAFLLAALLAALALPFAFIWASYDTPPGVGQGFLGVMSVAWLAGCYIVATLAIGDHSKGLSAFLVRIALLCVLCGTCGGLFQGRFGQAQPTLEQIAHDLQQGKPLTAPVWAGSFRITVAERNRHCIALWITKYESAFIKSPTNPRALFNTWECFRVTDDWWYLTED